MITRDNVGFGTVAGFYTVAELQDLVAAKDAEMRNTARMFAEISGLPYDFTAFLPLYNQLTSRYSAARAVAQKAIADAVGAWRPTNLIVADAEYQGLLSAVNPRWKENTWTPGDTSLESINDQLRKFGATGTGAEPIPQPSKGSDVDITAYQKLPDLTKVPHLFDTKHLIIYAVIGGVFVVFVLPKLMAMSLRMSPAGILAQRAF
jgi:hypothetical protein